MLDYLVLLASTVTAAFKLLTGSPVTYYMTEDPKDQGLTSEYDGVVSLYLLENVNAIITECVIILFLIKTFTSYDAITFITNNAFAVGVLSLLLTLIQVVLRLARKDKNIIMTMRTPELVQKMNDIVNEKNHQNNKVNFSWLDAILNPLVILYVKRDKAQ